ncbi:unnamed protein product [Cylicocyclus nassatus]|uniref:Lysosomal Pro-X carboxypeptidase n=1 Tax=Cylicocyclus nassatus TaxID=53992 RepID=A0AA36M4Z6_CYLNA|nr:unnamed protein product [Cylicocyclus nassatus]
MLLAILFFLPSLAGARRLLYPAVKRHVVDDSNWDATKPWTVNWISVKLDHFTSSDTRTFKMRWLLNNTYYKLGGPILFYTGNEGDIEDIATIAGMMWDLAPRYNAAVILAEHRFYGTSLPFGNDSYSSIANMGYLTSEQALADFAALLFALKTPNNGLVVSYPQEAKVIALGGSYGGMLAAWFRLKYPHVITGAWAASAPLLYFEGANVDPGAYSAIATNTYVNAGCNRFIVANSWNAILNLSYTEDGRSFLNTQFKIDPRSQIKTYEDGWNLVNYFREAIDGMAEENDPFPSSLPAWPVNVACSFLNASGTSFTDEELATRMYNAANIYHNSSGTLEYNCIDTSVCEDAYEVDDYRFAWSWQACTEIVINMCARSGENDFYMDECETNVTSFLIEQCNETFAHLNWTTDLWNRHAVPLKYGLSLDSVSNIILTQGEMDPWSGGGYTKNSPGVSEDQGIYVMKIPGAAHQLDLQTPNTCDPNTVTNARFQIVKILDCWLHGCQSLPRLTDLPEMVIPPNVNCTDRSGEYPWGQDSDAHSPWIKGSNTPALPWSLCTISLIIWVLRV